MAHYVPNGFHTVTPFILVKHADKVVEFLQRAFGAAEIYRLEHEDGSIWHSQVKLGDSMIMLGDVRTSTRRCHVRSISTCRMRMPPTGTRCERVPRPLWSLPTNSMATAPAGCVTPSATSGGSPRILKTCPIANGTVARPTN